MSWSRVAGCRAEESKIQRIPFKLVNLLGSVCVVEIFDDDFQPAVLPTLALRLNFAVASFPSVLEQ